MNDRVSEMFTMVFAIGLATDVSITYTRGNLLRSPTTAVLSARACCAVLSCLFSSNEFTAVDCESLIN